MPTQCKSDTRYLMEAAVWRTRLTEEDVESTPEFEMWLLAESRHRWAWQQVQQPWDLLGLHENSPELLELRRTALAGAREAARKRWGEVPSGSCDADDGQAHHALLGRSIGPSTKQILRRSAAAAGIGVFAVLAGLIWYLQSPVMYRTQSGERRVVTLEDGSQLQLDSLTVVSVAYSRHARDLSLLRGQARFDVAHDVERPFSVSAAGRKVVATGTAFDIDLLGNDLTVTLIEGHVVVLPPAAQTPQGPGAAGGTAMTPVTHRPRGIELSAGQQLVVSSGGDASVSTANIERTTAWQNGQLVFDNEPLESVILRVNRYAPHTLVIGDADSGQLRISGVFNSGDVDGFVDTLTRYLPVDAVARDGRIYLQRR